MHRKLVFYTFQWKDFAIPSKPWIITPLVLSTSWNHALSYSSSFPHHHIHQAFFTFLVEGLYLDYSPGWLFTINLPNHACHSSTKTWHHTTQDQLKTIFLQNHSSSSHFTCIWINLQKPAQGPDHPNLDFTTQDRPETIFLPNHSSRPSPHNRERSNTKASVVSLVETSLTAVTLHASTLDQLAKTCIHARPDMRISSSPEIIIIILHYPNFNLLHLYT